MADGVFDLRIDPKLTAEFLADPRHHLCVAIEDGVVVGMASAVHYVHPDKGAQLWINEVGVSPDYRRQGLASEILHRMLEHGRALGCSEAWVLTDEDNAAARGLYRAAGGAEAHRLVMVEFLLSSED